MKIKYVEISNILSIKTARLDFQESGLILLDGWNYDDDTANGAGKTALLNSLCFGLYGKLPRKISASEILREGTKVGHVQVGIEVGAQLFEIKRSRPNANKFWIDGVEKDMTQDEFESHLKMSYSQYLISMYSAQTEGAKLISLNDTGKKDFFLQLMNLDCFDECKKEIDTELKEQYKEKTKLEASISEVRARIDTYKESLVNEKDLNDELESFDLNKIKQKIDSLLVVEKPDVEKFENLENKLSDEYRATQRLEDNNASYLKEIGRLDVRMARLRHQGDELECPHCTLTFVPGEEIAKNELKELELEKSTLEAHLIDDQELTDKKNKLKETIVKCRNKKSAELAEFNKVQDAIGKLSLKSAQIEMSIRLINESLEKNAQTKNKIAENKRKLEVFAEKLVVLEAGIIENETLQQIFSPTGAPAYVLDSAIDVFNERVSHYTSMIWSNASYALLSFRENKAGDIKAKFSEKLIIGGKERSIGALSGGEHRCLSLAVDFAVVDVLETMFGIKINPIMLDEPFNDLDASNRERVLELLDKIAVDRQIWVIDHASEAKAMFSTVVKVEKRSGISAVV